MQSTISSFWWFFFQIRIFHPKIRLCARSRVFRFYHTIIYDVWNMLHHKTFMLQFLWCLAQKLAILTGLLEQNKEYSGQPTIISSILKTSCFHAYSCWYRFYFVSYYCIRHHAVSGLYCLFFLCFVALLTIWSQVHIMILGIKAMFLSMV